MNTNKNYKSSVFTMLFKDPDVLRELYCALKNVSLPPDTPVTINTLPDVLFMEKVNDISFEIGGKLVVLIEHQSTINPNMALRLLMYIARIYEKIVESKNIYSSTKLSIPRPEFFVLYNGTAPCPDESLIKLSELFEDPSGLGIPKDSPSLELEVKVLNINDGRNSAIAARCKELANYSAFVDKVRGYQGQGFSLKEAVRKAVYYCIKHDILKEFLKSNAGEVRNMLMTEWNWDDALEVRFEEGIQRGLGKGLQEGLERGIQQGRVEEREHLIELLTQGLSIEEIKRQLATPPVVNTSCLKH